MARPTKLEKGKFSVSIWRQRIVVGMMMTVLVSLGLRAFYLQVIDNDYLKEQGDARYLRSVSVKSDRGKILDRRGENLAISTPVDSIWVNPIEFVNAKEQWSTLFERLSLNEKSVIERLAVYENKQFMYLKRQMSPESAKEILDLNIVGVYSRREYKRYYPAGALTGHIIGFTNIDDVGQEGVELAFNSHLSGIDGEKYVLKDRKGHSVENVKEINSVENGKDIYLSIDTRIQNAAYIALKDAVNKNKAESGSLVMIDVYSGEIIAMVNEPSYNPNNRSKSNVESYRNRSITDTFEPGSTTKPLTIALGLMSGKYKANTVIDTTPGYMSVGGNSVKDVHNYGVLDVSTVLVKSSNVGVTKIALQFPAQEFVSLLRKFGYGKATNVELRGESSGYLPSREKWKPIEHATLAFGYGISVTPLQLAKVYAVLANGGYDLQISVLKQHKNDVRKKQLLNDSVVSDLHAMMARVVSKEGTARQAEMDYYTAAGKTGTAKKVVNGRYADGVYTATFAGYAPAISPRYAMVVLIDEPKGESYYGGAVAAPVFKEVMSEALRLTNVPPDKIHADRTVMNDEEKAGGA